ncbi:MAG: type II secretion system inner membrane protein GspF [bacterium]|nr:MAG: type II secretion system inner membrane protein GspF [bacterium]
MPLFEYSALDTKGRRQSGFVDAGNIQAARERLKGEGLFVVALTAAAAREAEPGLRSISLFGRVSGTDLASVTRQLATLLKAGLPLVQALEALIEQIEKAAVRKVLSSVRNHVNEGMAFHEALSEHPSVFPPLFIQMTKAGETGGFLEAIMLRLAETQERDMRLKSRVLAALVYPVIMTVLGFAFLLFLFAYVVPQVVGIFEDFGKALPVPTRILLLTSDFASRYWIVLVVCLVAAFIVYRRLSRSRRFGQTIDSMKLKLPLFGKLSLKIASARMCHVLASLLRSGVPLVRALEVVGEVLGNRVLSGAVDRAGQSVSQGSTLADSLRVSGLFPPLIPRVVAVGERSGQLSEMLSGVAESYEHDVQTSIQALTSILEPALILVMAVVVLFVVLAVLLPIFELNQLVRSG